MNVVVKQDELKHYGKLGMKWGKTLHGYAVKSLGKQTNKVIRRYDKGIATKDDASEISRRVRKQKFKMEAKVKRAQKYLTKANQADAKSIINRYNKNPEKRAMVEDYMKTMELHSKTLKKYRMDLIDVRL